MNNGHVSLALRASPILATLLFFACGHVRAATLCVSTSAQLQGALDNAPSQTDPYLIRIVASATPYQLASGNDPVYVPPTTTIKGGYAAGCGSQAENASGTVVDFGGHPVSFEQADTNVPNHIEFDDLTFQHGIGFRAEAGSVHTISDEPGYILIQNVRFTDFAGPAFGNPITFRATKGVTELVNVQFDHLQPSYYDCAVWIQGDNNSFLKANFVTADFTNGEDFCLAASYQGGAFDAFIDNSIVWGSDNGNPNIRGVDPSGHGNDLVVQTENSIYTSLTGYGTVAEVAHLSADPHWANASTGDYRLADPASPAVNNGTSQGALGVPYYDIDHGLRTVGSNPDRGAHESAFSNLNVLVVTSAADSGSQTLRAAITNANLLGGQHIITFNLPACPTVISLATPLPDITSAMTIDGYTQPGSFPNDSDVSFDANLCVLVKPAVGAVVAFRVPGNANGGANASLWLEGLGVGGFGQDVLLLGGANHNIRGNQFGGVANGVDLGNSPINIISVGVDANSFFIGGFGPQNRNLIGGAQGAFGNAINVQSAVASDTDHCRIVNNWIGLAPDLAALPNEYGIQLSGSGCAVYDNRISSSTLGNLWINGGHDNVIQHNIISDTSGLPNDAFGIRIDGSNNTIGNSAMTGIVGTLFANAVTDMAKGGIVVTSGSGNSIRGNYISWNGPNRDGAGMDIDLGGDGPTVNGSHASPGPNNWQVFPTIDRLVYLGHPPGGVNTPAAIEGHLDAAAGVYRVDAYYSNGCGAATGRAHPESYLEGTTVTIPVGQTSATFTFQVLLPSDADGDLGLTTSSVANGTSELGVCFPLANGIDDRIFHSGFGFGAEY